MNQHSHPATAIPANATPMRSCNAPRDAHRGEPDYRCPLCDGQHDHPITYCGACGEPVECYDNSADPADMPLTPAQAELVAVYAGHAIIREQAALTVRRQTAIVNLCADIRARVGRGK